MNRTGPADTGSPTVALVTETVTVTTSRSGAGAGGSAGCPPAPGATAVSAPPWTSRVDPAAPCSEDPAPASASPPADGAADAEDEPAALEDETAALEALGEAVVRSRPAEPAPPPPGENRKNADTAMSAAAATTAAARPTRWPDESGLLLDGAAAEAAGAPGAMRESAGFSAGAPGAMRASGEPSPEGAAPARRPPPFLSISSVMTTSSPYARRRANTK